MPAAVCLLPTPEETPGWIKSLVKSAHRLQQALTKLALSLISPLLEGRGSCHLPYAAGHCRDRITKHKSKAGLAQARWIVAATGPLCLGQGQASPPRSGLGDRCACISLHVWVNSQLFKRRSVGLLPLCFLSSVKAFHRLAAASPQEEVNVAVFCEQLCFEVRANPKQMKH